MSLNKEIPSCTYCGKSVYHAEEQQLDGNIFHIQCMGKHKKMSQQQDLRGRNVTYEKQADVQPSYYRVADTTVEARMESGAAYKQEFRGGVEISKENECVCGACTGTVTRTQKFCGHCGAKLG
eukprot:TRINITY_DN15936_c0_g1_i1.p1 TRINITY_DN15936_c0_g1~~TRINITY_DN15936_c0_g1_i1.p1  ORF type:complete len:123 (+),score=32.23 TRINITY_DN15936_c0_g1_i1:72-440(+)